MPISDDNAQSYQDQASITAAAEIQTLLVLASFLQPLLQRAAAAVDAES